MTTPAYEIRNLVYQLLRTLESNDRDTCACFDVTHLQALVMLELVQNQPLNMQQLAECMQLAVSTMSRVVDKLVEAGFISRQTDKNDRRMVYCSLTKEGVATARQLEECYNGFFEQIIDKIPARDLPGFLNGLRIFVKQIQACGDSCACGSK